MVIILDQVQNKTTVALIEASLGQAVTEISEYYDFIVLKTREVIDKGYAAFETRDTASRTKCLDAARRYFMQARANLRNSDIIETSLWRDIYWGLMVTEKEMSGYPGFDIEIRLEHLAEAEAYRNLLAGNLVDSQEVGRPIQLRLEQNILKGQRASLESQKQGHADSTREMRHEAVKEIDKALEELKDLDPARYHENLEYAKSWCKRLTKVAL